MRMNDFEKWFKEVFRNTVSAEKEGEYLFKMEPIFKAAWQASQENMVKRILAIEEIKEFLGEE